MASKPKLLCRPYKPFGRIVLIPLDSIAIVHWELVMKVVVPFTNCHESSSEVVSRSMFVIERRLSEPVSKRVDAKSRLDVYDYD